MGKLAEWSSGPLGRILVVGSMLALWEMAAWLGFLSPFFFSSPSEVWAVIQDWFWAGRIFRNVGVTFLEASVGFAIGTSIGVLLGFALAFMPRVAQVLEPFMAVLNAFPRLTLAPLFIVWFGFGIEPKILLVATFILFLCYLNTYNGLRQVPQELIDRAKLWGATKIDLARTIYLPSAMAWILTGLRASVGFAIIGAVVGEYIGGDRGIGFLILQGQSRLRIREVFAGLALLLVAAVLIDYGLRKLEARLLRWRPETTTTSAGAG
ncbi:MAG: ABC transporter permease [Hyphomonadaceae bacterium]|jgi:NitT/TauT family transport system permease protein|nr:ABC transporter permease [Hyphomonadaceae bacterium]